MRLLRQLHQKVCKNIALRACWMLSKSDLCVVALNWQHAAADDSDNPAGLPSRCFQTVCPRRTATWSRRHSAQSCPAWTLPTQTSANNCNRPVLMKTDLEPSVSFGRRVDTEKSRRRRQLSTTQSSRPNWNYSKRQIHGGPKLKENRYFFVVIKQNIDRLTKFFHWQTQQKICKI